MGTPVTVAELQEEIRVRLGLPSIASGSFWTTAAALNLVKYSARRLSGIVRRLDADYFLTTTNISTVAGINEVSLPANFSDLRALSWMRSTDERVPMELASVDDFDGTGETAEAWQSAPRYRLASNVLLVFPKPSAVYTLSMYYDTGIYVTATADFVSCQPGWDEWIVLDCCIRLRQQEEISAADFIAERNKVEADIVRQASARDRFSTHQIRDLWEGGDVIDSRSLWVRR